MNKARLISLVVLLSLLAFYLQGVALSLSSVGGPLSWFDGH